MQMQPFRLSRFRNRIELELLLSLVVDRPRTVLAVKGPLRRAEAARPGPLRAVLKNFSLYEGKEDWEMMALASKHLAFYSQTTHALRLEAPAQRQRGWMPKLFAASTSRGSFFS
jgi:hypothetical protein